MRSPLLRGPSLSLLLTAVGALAVSAACSDARPTRSVGTTTEPIVGGLGNVTVSTTTTVNRYTALNADAKAGDTTITVTDATGLNPAAGDLLLVIQMQGATIDGTNTKAAFGDVTAVGGAGTFEMVTVASFDGAKKTITFNAGCGLKNAYSKAGHTQVVWVPQYDTLTIAAGGKITAPAWDGNVGGIVAIQANNVAFTGGSIDASALGFRGGVVHNQSDLNLPTANFIVRGTTNTSGGEKGESIAGFEADYDVAAIGGRYGIGAPANGGGGGSPHNGGGGGGANGNNGNPWTGAGVMSALDVGGTAWALDPDYIANGKTFTNSSGGGRGGYSYSANNGNALTQGPGDTGWGGDNRQYRGGLGGHPLANDALSRVFVGGGGGAGDENNGGGGAGGVGGGLIYLVAGSVTGLAGSMHADGGAGQSTSAGGNDAPGGGGGGGTVVVVSPNNVAPAIVITANGGAAGNQSIATTEAEGPGGGGGGGFIAVPFGTTIPVPAGAPGGTTNSSSLSEFPKNGATGGATGQVVVLAANPTAPICIASDLSITKTDGTTSIAPGSTVTYTITATNNGPNPVTGAVVVDTFPAAITGVTWTCAGTGCPAPSGVGNINATLGTVPGGGTVTFTAKGTVSATATGTIANTATLTPPKGITDGNNGNNSATDTDNVTPAADLSVSLSNTPTSPTAGGAYSYTVGVSNAGPATSGAVTVTITLPAGATYTGDVGAGWTCSAAGTTVTCTHAAIASGGSAPLTINATAPSAAGTTNTTATISSTTADPTAGNNTANDSITFACATDANCGATQWCNAGTCINKTPNGQPVPVGTCGPTTSHECLTGACDTNGNVCGVKLGDGTCSATAQCITGQCITAGPNNGKCEECTKDADCATSAGGKVCDTTKNVCVQCTTGEATACANPKPACSTAAASSDTCVACNGDNGDTTATAACPTSAAPTCTLTGANTGSCGKCTTNSDCTGHPLGNVCNTTTGACGNTCSTDADCPSGDWCNASTCTPKTPNGQPVPVGTCGPTTTHECLSGACDTNGNVCGIALGDGTCTGDTQCIAGTCQTTGPNTGKCENSGCTKDADCNTATEWCNAPAGGSGSCVAKLTNGTPLPTTPTDVSTCSDAVGTRVCVSGVCDTKDNTCGLAQGDGPCSGNTQCREGVCNATNVCGCATDTDCASTEFCDGTSSTCAPKLPNGDPCTRPAMCQSANCGADGTCTGGDAGADAGEDAATDAGDTGITVDGGSDGSVNDSSVTTDSGAPIDNGETLQGGGCAYGTSSSSGSSRSGGAALAGLIALGAIVARRFRAKK